MPIKLPNTFIIFKWILVALTNNFSIIGFIIYQRFSRNKAHDKLDIFMCF